MAKLVNLPTLQGDLWVNPAYVTHIAAYRGQGMPEKKTVIHIQGSPSSIMQNCVSYRLECSAEEAVELLNAASSDEPS